MSTSAQEVASGQRFAFGDNWRRFLRVIDQQRIDHACESLQAMLGPIEGKRFLDAGCGSGLFSLAAAKLGASVHSFDFDPQSVACCQELKSRFLSDSAWTIESGSVLDTRYMQSLGKFDIVYSWGVLHHTGRMYDALANAAALVAKDGQLFISIYNDQGLTSRLWRTIKRSYNRLPRVIQPLTVAAIAVPFEARYAATSLLKLQVKPLTRRWFGDGKARGMAVWRDWVDWVGGYPFEVAKPEEIFEFLHDQRFSLERLKTCGGGLGCNEFVFKREN